MVQIVNQRKIFKKSALLELNMILHIVLIFMQYGIAKNIQFFCSCLKSYNFITNNYFKNPSYKFIIYNLNYRSVNQIFNILLFTRVIRDQSLVILIVKQKFGAKKLPNYINISHMQTILLVNTHY